MSHILINSLTPDNELGGKTIKSDYLENNLKILYTFIGDFKNDFITKSLEIVSQTSYNFYLS